MQILILVALIVMAVFLILLVLVQRGRGGGLTGALGGMGGQSAFGAKAGDTFTKITMWSAFIWIVLCILSVRMLGGSTDALSSPGLNSGGSATETDGDGAGAGTGAPADDAEPADNRGGGPASSEDSGE